MNALQSIGTVDKKGHPERSEPTLGNSPKARALRKAETLASIHTVPAGDLEVADRKEVLALVGKEIASDMGSHVLLGMLAETGKSMRQVARDSGFDVSVLSNIANGNRVSGPELWTLAALAEAMELDLQLSFSKRGKL